MFFETAGVQGEHPARETLNNHKASGTVFPVKSADDNGHEAVASCSPLTA